MITACHIPPPRPREPADISTMSADNAAESGVLRVFLVDDHEVVRRGLIDLLSTDPELRVVGEAGSVAQAMTLVPAARPDVAVLDVRLPDGNGIELCRNLLAQLPALRCLMLTFYTSEQGMLDASLAGARGYLLKDIRNMQLAQVIKAVGADRSLLDNRAATGLMAKSRGTTPRSAGTVRTERRSGTAHDKHEPRAAAADDTGPFRVCR